MVFVAAFFTIAISAFCSLLEAMILSTTTSEIEGLKQKDSKKGKLLEAFKEDIEETSSAILSLNTVANTLGATMTGVLASQQYGADSIWSRVIWPAGMTIGILILSEVLPKNLGVIYRPSVQPYLIYPLHFVRLFMLPISAFCKILVIGVAGKKNTEEVGDEDIILLAEKSAKEGNLTQDERAMISNALSLDDVRVADVMTPRTVVTAFDKDMSIGELFEEQNNIQFARIPVFDDNIDNITGIVRRRDLLKAKADDRDNQLLDELKQEVTFVPENANVTHALQKLLKTHQQMAVVVDEFATIAGVITMEDIVEQILGKEIFEKDDVAIDMRELARRKKLVN